MELPPPYHGVSTINQLLASDLKIQKRYDLDIIRLTKPKLSLGGALSFGKIKTDIIITLKILWSTIVSRPQIIYFCLAQTRIGLWRESLWIWMAKLWGSKCLVHIHPGDFRNMFENELSKGERQFFKLTLGQISGIILLDPSLFWLFTGLVPERLFFVMPNGIPDYWGGKKIQMAISQRADSEKLRVTFLSNLIPGKGFDIFLETAALLKSKGGEREFVFNLAGSPPSPDVAESLQDFIRRHELQDSVRVFGPVIEAEKWNLLINSDVLVFPSRLNEGQPVTIIEALSVGLPVISTPRGAIPSMVQDGINGFMVSGDSPDEIAERLILLKEDGSLRLSMSRTSRELYQIRYTEDEFIHRFIAIVDKVIGSP